MGGAPRLIFRKTGDSLPEFDTYGDAAIDEVVSSFERCRRSICRTHVCFVASEFYKQEPDVFIQQIGPKERRGLSSAMEEVFWEHAETSYIRLASYWDRIGQFLDFIFFNVRQYERDGFASVMNRIFLKLCSSVSGFGGILLLASVAELSKFREAGWVSIPYTAAELAGA